jgi:hypothetical protein
MKKEASTRKRVSTPRMMAPLQMRVMKKKKM